MVRAARKTNKSKSPPSPVVTNEAIADTLTEIADLLEKQGANPYRVRAYRQGAETVRHAQQPLQRILAEHGVRGLMKLRGIGDSLAGAIEKIIHAKKLPLLSRLRGGGAPERLFSTVADIGPKLAARIHDELGITTLTELEAACWDGRLAHRDRLMRVAPRRYNPEGRAWLPILHTERDGRHYTALYSNTSRAHELGALRDWVVIYREDKKLGGMWTVITARMGPLKGKRVVRGREVECQDYYDEQAAPEPVAVSDE
jgi:putative hydrolase